MDDTTQQPVSPVGGVADPTAPVQPGVQAPAEPTMPTAEEPVVPVGGPIPVTPTEPVADPNAPVAPTAEPDAPIAPQMPTEQQGGDQGQPGGSPTV